MRLDKIEGYWWMKPNSDGREEFFACVDSTYYSASDYTQVTDAYKEQYEREHPIPEPVIPEEVSDSEALDIITGRNNDV